MDQIFNRIQGISQKYDCTLDYGIDMYDNLPYQRDADICNVGSLALYSGHIIKYYLCNNQQENFIVNNRDDQIEYILQKIQEQESLHQPPEDDSGFITVPTEDVTEEQIQGLLQDTADGMADEDDSEYPEETVNLDDIEDW